MQAERTCKCGCGERPNTGKVYVHGHNARVMWAAVRDYEVDPATDCWNWQRSMGGDGYGRAYRDGAMRLAHRVVYERVRGPIPTGAQLDHLCRNTRCVNPDHLEPVTNALNVRRSSLAKLTWADVHVIRASGLRNIDLAVIFDVDGSTISQIRHHRRWREGLEELPGVDS